MKCIFLLLLFVVFTSFHTAVKEDDILGVWITEGGKAHVHIYKKEKRYFGKIIYLKEPNRDGKPKVDIHNPNAKLRTRPVLGLLILRDFVFDEDEWNDGRIYDAESGKDYACYMVLESENKMKVRGYIGISLIGRTSYWTRKQ